MSEAETGFRYMGSFRLQDVCVRDDDMEPITIEKHDCRTDSNRTGLYRRIVRPCSDETVWVFDPMQVGVFLYIASWCHYCGRELSSSTC